MVHDLVVAGGRIVDGCGNPWYRGDVAVRGDRVAAIGAPGTLRGRRVVDAADRYVTPGFIDPHTHSDLTILLHPRRGDRGASGRHDARHRQLRHVGGAADGRSPGRRRPELGALRLGAGSRGLGLAHVPPVSGRRAPRRPRDQHRAARRPRRAAARRRGLRRASRHRARAGAHGAAARRLPARGRARHVERARLPAGLLREHRGAPEPVQGRGAPPGHLHEPRARRAGDDPRRGRGGARARARRRLPRGGLAQRAQVGRSGGRVGQSGADRGGAPRRPRRHHRQRRPHRPGAAVLAGAAAARARPGPRRAHRAALGPRRPRRAAPRGPRGHAAGRRLRGRGPARPLRPGGRVSTPAATRSCAAAPSPTSPPSAAPTASTPSSTSSSRRTTTSSASSTTSRRRTSAPCCRARSR